MNEEKDEITDCRERGLGHYYVQLSEDELSITYCCTQCGKEYTEPKKPLIQPERQHDK